MIFSIEVFELLFKMEELLEEADIRTHFNIVEEGSSLSLTLINPNITLETMQHLKNTYSNSRDIKSIEVVIIECPNFDDNLLGMLAKAIPQSITELILDFTGCESLRGEGFLELFERLDGLQLTKLSLDMGSVSNINDIVIQGLSLLLSNLNGLRQLYLDFYQIGQLTEDAYLLLAQSISELKDLTHFHIDLSANTNLSEDALQILFSALSAKLASFSFKILDIDHIGGGSFFKLAESLTEMRQLASLELTISTFTTLNQKGIYSILKAIGGLQKLRVLNLNLSNIDLPEKMISYLNFSKCLDELNLDLSCNRRIAFNDILNLGTKISSIRAINLNFDFCSGVTEDAIEEVVFLIAQKGKCMILILRDRVYSPQFQNLAVQRLMDMKSLFVLSIMSKQQSKRMIRLKQMLSQKARCLVACRRLQQENRPRIVNQQILSLLFCQH